MKVAWTVLLLSLCLSISSCDLHRGKTSLQKLQLKGNVKFLAEYEYQAKQHKGTFILDTIPSQLTIRFNNRGNWTEEYSWLPGNKSYRMICSFDEDGKETGGTKYNSDNTICYKNILKFDDKGQAVARFTYDKDGKLNMRISYIFDTKGNKTEEDAYWADSNLMHRYVFSYDARGNVTEFNYFNEDSTLLMRSVYENDTNGMMIREHKYGSDDTTGWIINYSYDQYDAKGNWLRKTTSEGDKIKTVTRRRIEYF